MDVDSHAGNPLYSYLHRLLRCARISLCTSRLQTTALATATVACQHQALFLITNSNMVIEHVRLSLFVAFNKQFSSIIQADVLAFALI